MNEKANAVRTPRMDIGRVTVQNARAGYFNVPLYKTWRAEGYGSGSHVYFRDITQGSIPPYQAGPGYDQMSGIGAMQVSNFASLLHR